VIIKKLDKHEIERAHVRDQMNNYKRKLDKHEIVRAQYKKLDEHKIKRAHVRD